MTLGTGRLRQSPSVPAYLDSFVDGGGLRDIVAEGNRDDLHAWARTAIEDIDARRSEFVDSLNVRETALRIKIDGAFARTINVNANVTAYLADPERTYSQSCMLFDHLEKRQPDALYALIYRINSDQIVSNDQPITALLELTGKSVRELEEAYQSHARGGRARRAR